MKARLLLPAVLAATLILPARVSAQEESPSIERSIGVTAAEIGVALAGSCVGVLGAFALGGALVYPSLALTPALSAAGAYGAGAWLDPGGQFGATALGGYAGAVVVGLASGVVWHFATIGSDFNFVTPAAALVGYVAGASVGSVLGYKLSRRRSFEEETRWQLIPPSMGLALKRPAAGRPMEIAGVRVNLLAARF